MAHLEQMLGPPTPATLKQAKNSFIGANQRDKQSEEVTGGGKITTHLKLEQRTWAGAESGGKGANRKVSAPDRQQSSPIKERTNI